MRRMVFKREKAKNAKFHNEDTRKNKNWKVVTRCVKYMTSGRVVSGQ